MSDHVAAEKKQRVELPPNIPREFSKVQFLVDFIEKNNQKTKPKERIRSGIHAINLGIREALRTNNIDAAIEIALEAIDVHRVLPRPSESLAPILYQLKDCGRVDDGVIFFERIMTSVFSSDSLAGAHSAFETDSLITLGLRLHQANIGRWKLEESSLKTKALLDRIPATMMKRRLLAAAIDTCLPTHSGSSEGLPANIELMWQIVEIANSHDVELWDRDFSTMLDIVVTSGALNINEEVKKILTIMEPYVPVTGNTFVKKLMHMFPSTAIVIEPTTIINDTGVCKHCGTSLQGFSFTAENYAKFAADIFDKLIVPSFSKVSHYETDSGDLDSLSAVDNISPAVECVPKVVGGREARERRFTDFVTKVESLKFDAVIDGANLGYYGVTNWYSATKKELLIHRLNRSEESIKESEIMEMTLPIDVCPRFKVINDAYNAAVELGYTPIIILHERHVFPSPRLYGENESILKKWQENNWLLASPYFINDDYCWLYANALKKGGCVIISNDLMRDHHFQMLSQRSFIRWRQRHRITFSVSYCGKLSLRQPRVFSTWIQSSSIGCGKWHIPFVEVPILEQHTNKGASPDMIEKDGDDDCFNWMCISI